VRGLGSTAMIGNQDGLSRLGARAAAAIKARGIGATLVIVVMAGMLVVVGWVVSSNLGAAPLPIRVASLTVGVLFVIAGLVGIRQRPESPVGAFLVLVGLLYLVGRLQGADPPPIGLVANLANSAWQGIVFYVTFSFPVGRLRTPVDGVFVIGGFIFTLLNNLFVLVTTPGRSAPGLGTANPWFADLPAAGLDVARPILLVVGYALILGGAAWLTRRWLAASRPLRRVLTPVYLSAVATSLTAIVLRLTVGVVSPSTDVSQVISIALLLAYGLLPIGFLIGLMRAQMARAAVADLVVELGELPTPARLRTALAAALGDPTLEVVTWSGERHAFVDAAGRVVAAPAADAGRSVTILQRAGQPSAILVHDPAVLEDPGLVSAVGTAVRLALDNEQLEIQVGHQLEEVRASRARVAAAADAARQRIERDIHDATQQRLLGVSLSLEALRGRLDGGSAAAAELDAVRGQLSAALVELRELARGIHPAVLTQHGLDAALKALSRRSSVPVDLEVTIPSGRLPAALEAAVYFIASSALSNAVAHAAASQVVIRVEADAGDVRLTVVDDGIGGATEGTGTGLTGMRDRAETVGGALGIDSPHGGPTQISAVLPLGGAHVAG
jgi:signal transduction histidine kinase